MYELLIKRSAERDLRKLSKSVFGRVNKRILALPEDPYPPGVRKLGSPLAGWSIRFGDYHVLYQIDEEAQVLTIIRVRHRRDVYRQSARCRQTLTVEGAEDADFKAGSLPQVK